MNGRLKKQVLTSTKIITNNVGSNRGEESLKENWNALQKNVKGSYY